MRAFLKDVFPKISSAALKARLKSSTHFRRMMMGKLASYIFASLLFAHAAGLANEAVRIIEQTENSIRIEISAPIPIIRDTTVAGQSYSSLQVKNWPHAAQDQQAGLPFKSVLLHLASKEAAVEILSAEENRLTMRPPLVVQDEPIGPDSLLSDSVQKAAEASGGTDVQNAPVASLRYLGQFKSNHLWSLDVFPYRYDTRSGRLIMHPKVLVEIHSSPSKEAGISLPIPAQEKQALKNMGAISLTQNKTTTFSQQRLSKQAAETGPSWKILVDKDGLYHLTGRDLQSAGVKLFDVDIKNLKLTANGQDVPIYVHGWKDGQFDEDDYFEFWGEYHRADLPRRAPDLYQDIYSKSNVYWLSWSSRGQWMAEEQGLVLESNAARTVRPYSFYETVHVESDGYYDRLTLVPADSLRDFWFFDTGIASAKKKEYAFNLWHPDDLSPLPVKTRVMMCGRTVADPVPHSIDVFLNESYIGAGKWWYQNYLDLHSEETTPLVGSDLVHGRNVLTVVNSVEAQAHDFVMLNWFEVTYPRLYRAHQGMIKFGIPPNYDPGLFLFKVDGFEQNQVDIYKLGLSKITGASVEQVTDLDNFTSYQIAFQDQVSSLATEYVAVEPSAKMKPVSIIPAAAANLKSDQLAADYLIITHKRFIDTPSLDKLVRHRQSQGYRVLKVDVQDVFDEFGYGRPSPYAVKDFLRWAYQYYQRPAPKFVLLVGDGCYIRYASTKDTLDLVPVYMLQTMKFGAAASDHWYALVDGDDEIPDVHIGRLPARDAEGLGILVDKIIAYETEPLKGDWRHRLLVIGGNGQVFRTQGISLTTQMPPQFEPKMLYTTKDYSLPYDPFFGGTADLLDYFDSGCALMTFHGHGGGAIWSDNGLLRLEDVDRIHSRGKFPLILSMTCFTGAFESPSEQNLADALLFAKEEGTMAFMGASGVGWTTNDFLLLDEILQYFYKNPSRPVGEIIDAGKISYWAKYQFSQPQAFSEINQYHLLGDPAIPLTVPDQVIPVSISDAIPNREDTLKCSTTLPFANGSGRFDISDSTNRTHSSQNVAIANHSATTALVIPKTFSAHSGYVRFYGSDDLGLQQAHGAVEFSLAGVLFDSVEVIRQNVDSLYFKTHIQRRYAISRMVCTVMGDTIEMKDMAGDWFLSQRGLMVPAYYNTLSYSFTAEMSNGAATSSQVYSYHLPKAVDLAIKYQSVRLVGDRQVALQAEITNYGDYSADQVVVLFEQYVKKLDRWVSIGADTVSLGASVSKIVEIPFAAKPGRAEVRVTIDPQAALGEANRYNNQGSTTLEINSFNYISGKGIVIAGATIDTLHYDAALDISIPAGAMATDAVLKIQPIQTLGKNEQPDFVMLTGTPTYKLSLSGSESGLINPVHVALRLDANLLAWADSTGLDLYLFRFVPATRKWLRVASERNNSILSATLTELATIAVLAANDTQPPTIEISVDGQPLIPGSYASPEPQIAVLLQDINGIDISPAKLQVVLDGKSLDRNELALPDSIANANQVMLMLKPVLLPGQHSLSVSASDCNGNIAPTAEITLNVAKEFEVTMLGNYPNPFEEETTFAYVLSLPSEKMSLKIYTASGRLIRNLQPTKDAIGDPNPLGPDYHEMVWDGADLDGNDVANGVYFYRLEATSAGKTKQVTGKIARIQ